MDELLIVFLKLILTVIMGGLIGLERELTGHEAGIRTQILVALGSATFIIVGLSSDMSEGDISRIIQGVVTGLGFLGGGAIIKEGLNVKGLTTAASIWVTAAIGVSVGFGSYGIAALTFMFAILSLSILGIVQRKLYLKQDSGMLSITIEKGISIPRKKIDHMKKSGISFDSQEFVRTSRGTDMVFNITIPHGFSMDDIIDEFLEMDGIIGVEWEDLTEETHDIFKR
jgi:putative Mg2+ transporter-C (MgtC) family protein